jgi:hypothetical protein
MKTPALLLSIFVMVQCAMAQAIFTPEIPALNIAHCAFDHIQVIDARKNKEDIGYLKKGAFNSKVVLQPEGSMEQMLKDLGTRIIQSAQQKGDATLLIIVRDFVIEDRPIKSGPELGSFHARMDFYIGNNDSFTSKKHFEDFYETGSGWDVTKGLQKLASQKIISWFMQLTTTDTGMISINPLSQYQIKESIVNEYKPFPIYNQIPKKGIYYTFDEFINNNPRDTAFVEKKVSSEYGKVYYFFTSIPGKKRGENLDKIDCYAVFDGSTWFKKTSTGIMPMKFEDGDFYYSEIGNGIKMSDGSIAFMFGLVGTAIETAANSGNRKGNALFRVRIDPYTNTYHYVKRLY